MPRPFSDPPAASVSSSPHCHRSVCAMCHEPSTSSSAQEHPQQFLETADPLATVHFLFDFVFRIGTRSQCILFLLMALLIPCSAKGKCFNTQIGMSIEGGNYRRIRNFEDRACAKECIEDFSCFGYEWNSEEKVCYLKSRSTSGKLVAKQNTLVGFCQDDEDEVRYRLQDHVVVGPVILEADDVPDGEECKDNCLKVGALYYSWRPNETPMSIVVPTEESEDEEEERLGHCECISTMNEIRLEYDAFSGFIPVPKHKHRRSIYLRAFGI